MGKIYPKAPPTSPVAASSESPSITVLGTTPASASHSAFGHWPTPAQPYDIPGLTGRAKKTFGEPEMMAEIRKARAAAGTSLRIQLTSSPLTTPRKKKPPKTTPCCTIA